MCGIFGVVAHNARIPDGMLEQGTLSLAHRGPDDSGTVLLQENQVEVGLGNRRLAILDLSPLGHQPMHDPATGDWIVYNGEIYNFPAVRAELERAGITFVGHSDTEVLLKAYGLWGRASLEKLRGMFAFAIWDSRRQTLFIARDPMGVKPLYYAQSGSFFVFSSEVRSILGTGLVPARLDETGLSNFLTFGSLYDPFTLVSGIRCLLPGHALTWKSGTIEEKPYWDLVDRASMSTAHEELTKSRLPEMIHEAVRLQLISDVPVGVFLSGGIDSSALVSILSDGGVTPRTFSIVFGEADFSEAEHSRAVAAKFRTDHHEIKISQGDALAAIPEALNSMDLPTMDGVNTYLVSRETRRAGIKVALSGLGGDEVFAGYSTFRTVPQMERFAKYWRHFPRIVRGPLTSAFQSLARDTDANRKLVALARANGRLLHPYFLSRMLFTPAQRDSLYVTAQNSITAAAEKSTRDWLDRSLSLDPVNRVSYLESRCYMANTLLRDSDVMSMAHGLEVRVPLIDHQLAKLVLSIPARDKLNGTPKKLLVEALQNQLPDEIVHRKKRGFTLPFAHWLRDELRSQVEPVLAARRIDDGPLGRVLNGHQVQQVWKDFLAGSVSWTRPWALYVLQRWCETYSVCSQG